MPVDKESDIADCDIEGPEFMSIGQIEVNLVEARLGRYWRHCSSKKQVVVKVIGARDANGAGASTSSTLSNRTILEVSYSASSN